MEFKGAKGKWSLSIPQKEGTILINGNVRAQVLSFGNSGLKSEDLANAKLIACAPTLLILAIEFVKAVENEDIIIQENTDSESLESTGSYLYQSFLKVINSATE